MIALVAVGWAQDAPAVHHSSPAEVVFHDVNPMFAAASADTGWRPSASSVLAVRFQIVPTGGVETTVVADSGLSWGDRFEQLLTPAAGQGRLAVDTSLAIDLDAKIDISIWDGTIDIWDTDLTIAAERLFDTFAFLDGPETVEVVVDDVGTFQPFETSIGLPAGLSLDVTVDVVPELTTLFTTDRVECRMGAQVVDLFEEGLPLAFDISDDRVGTMEVTSTLIGGHYSLFDLVVVPGLALDTPIGGFDLASFDIPINLLDTYEERRFEPVVYDHPLPMMTEAAIDPAGTLLLGEQVNLHVPLENLGTLALEGTARIEGGGGFTVFPEYFAATEGNAAGVTVTFAPTTPGDKIAFLVLETNDPVYGTVRLPLTGTAVEPVPTPEPPPTSEDVGGEGVNGEDVRGCGCQSSPSPALGLLPVGALALMRRRR
jgi:MYXO-CTERM domain-containing protein